MTKQNPRQYFILSMPFLWFGLAVMLLNSCHSPSFFEENKAIPESGWTIRDTVHFEVTVKDTLTAYSFYLNVRNSSDYPYSNIFFFITTTFPDHKIARDTVGCYLAAPDGRWLGKGWGSVKENHILFKKGVRFPKTGTYRFAIGHAMRDENLKGIFDVGLDIEKSRTK